MCIDVPLFGSNSQHNTLQLLVSDGFGTSTCGHSCALFRGMDLEHLGIMI